MEYEKVEGHIKRLRQTGVYVGLELLSESECEWKDNVDAVQREVAIFNDRRAALHEAKVRSDVSEQWDPTCTVKQDKVGDVCWVRVRKKTVSGFSLTSFCRFCVCRMLPLPRISG